MTSNPNPKRPLLLLYLPREKATLELKDISPSRVSGVGEEVGRAVGVEVGAALGLRDGRPVGTWAKTPTLCQ